MSPVLLVLSRWIKICVCIYKTKKKKVLIIIVNNKIFSKLLLIEKDKSLMKRSSCRMRFQCQECLLLEEREREKNKKCKKKNY